MIESTPLRKGQLKDDFRQLMSDIEELLRVTAGQAGDDAAEVRNRIQSQLHATREQLVELQDVAIAKAKAAGHATDEFVHENPWQSIGIASAIGLVVGLLITRR